jgi:hypothetical protein
MVTYHPIIIEARSIRRQPTLEYLAMAPQHEEKTLRNAPTGSDAGAGQ